MQEDMTPNTSVEVPADAVTDAVSDGSELSSGFGEFVKRISEGDLGADTWILFWQSIGQPIALAIVLIIAVFFVAGWARRIATKVCRKAQVEETLARFVSNIARYAVLFAGGIAILGTLGIETASFAAALAAVGFAIGMALSGMLGNVAAGVMLLFFRPFKVGDVVNAAGVTGKVFEISLFTTMVDTPDNRRIIVPNNGIFGGNIENVTYHDTRRVDVAVGTDYGADLDKTREVLKKVADSVEGNINEPAAAVVLTGLGGSSIDWSVRVWAKTPDYFAVADRLNRNIKVALDEAGIGIPFPQMDVHIDGKVNRD